MKNTCLNCENENNTNAKYCSACGYQLHGTEDQNSSTATAPRKAAKTDKKFDLKTLLGFTIGFAIMFAATQFFFKPSMDKQLTEFANEFNKTCPMSVDQYTTLKNISVLPDKTIQYNYVLVGITKEQVQVDTVKKYIFPQVLQYAKTHPDMKFFRDNDITLNYSYADKTGAFITKYTVTPQMYK
ncbi:zinc ribbon domain-containing protein [Flavobacterium johnsoniae]|jgi:hypothetical protein|uniref:Uncharacterized protein n=1 Tax=Flavobacterium johnsoniae (strain ATCC 17061 / DSM 2064 / JCM 8514 / BCRC 14874 / CCUG 350202 / NBRC 14942 / NCIMB 11054 / UW101) TaxID=376686 RepID=A5FDF7_FLAJ1|nr:zinc ribbon domain-containing protein [Flavobacterium johnsoniae]ABQ06763.1 hypothetical protein Fjoh_3750 [Flavobacterium johnsoniae UW101]OXE97374.1 zinc ribbon domain-containing protein [Flavobacterium johnsoniae UW101]WQG81408.1 zinc ribbon domain-containing protein [Flavobacterium johnsoniae UW101]SHL41445.1 hypothetical protein SAMN05444146_3774 [Flavobacterium johnsoniae]